MGKFHLIQVAYCWLHWTTETNLHFFLFYIMLGYFKQKAVIYSSLYSRHLISECPGLINSSWKAKTREILNLPCSSTRTHTLQYIRIEASYAVDKSRKGRWYGNGKKNTAMWETKITNLLHVHKGLHLHNPQVKQNPCGDVPV